jgi:FAD binding domain/Berberine and berberine like
VEDRIYQISTWQILNADRAAISRQVPRSGSNLRLDLPAAELEFLKAGLVGRVVLPGDRGYDADRRVFNRRFDPRPSAIVHCEVERDVRLCLDAVRGRRTQFRIRAGGNSFAGYSASDGVIIDVKGLDDVSVDRERRVASVAAGCSFAKLQAILEEHRFHLPLGDAKDVSVGGFMQGGGFGLTSRTYGMNCDHVIEARVMLADGRIVRANEDINHDLWWAIRGGTGGNFGVLLAVRYALHPAPELSRWCSGWRLSRDSDLDNAVSALMTLQESFMSAASPSQMNASATVLHAADSPDGVPRTPWMLMWGTYVGSEARMDRLLEPLRRNPGCWPRLEPVLGTRHRRKFDRVSRLVSRPLKAEDWRALLVHFLTNAPNRQSTLQVDVWGGAIRDRPVESSAFIHRDAACNIGMTAWWETEKEEHKSRSFLSSWADLVAPFGNGGIYQNFPSTEVRDYQRSYWGAALAALAAAKRKYDPNGLFDFPQAIRPARVAGVRWPPKVVRALRRSITRDP